MSDKKVAVLLANGFEEGEAIWPADILRRLNINTDLISIQGNLEVTGAHGITIRADKTLADVEQTNYDMLVLPGGLPGADNLRDDKNVISWVKIFAASENKFIGAICAAPQVLARADVVRGKRVTSYPADAYRSVLTEAGAEYIDDERVVIEDNGRLITSRGPGTAMEFAYTLAEALGADPTPLKSAMLAN